LRISGSGPEPKKEKIKPTRAPAKPRQASSYLSDSSFFAILATLSSELCFSKSSHIINCLLSVLESVLSGLATVHYIDSVYLTLMVMSVVLFRVLMGGRDGQHQ